MKTIAVYGICWRRLVFIIQTTVKIGGTWKSVKILLHQPTPTAHCGPAGAGSAGPATPLVHKPPCLNALLIGYNAMKWPCLHISSDQFPQ